MEIEALLNVDLHKLLSSLIIAIVSIILYVITSFILFLVFAFFFGFWFAFNLYFYLKKRKREQRLIEVKKGNIKYKPIELNYDDFINLCRKGLPVSIIKLDNEYYNISCVLYEDIETEKYKFLCTINNRRFRSLEALKNYKFNGKKLNEFNKIIIMEIDNNDPKDFY